MPAKRTVSLAEVVAAGSFSYVRPCFKLENEPRWTDLGDRVRGRFYVMRLSHDYRKPDADAALARESARLNRNLRHADAYETAAFAALGVKNGRTPQHKSNGRGWNGANWLVGFGSSYVEPDGYQGIPCVWGGGGRRLGLFWADGLRNRSELVLCVYGQGI